MVPHLNGIHGLFVYYYNFYCDCFSLSALASNLCFNLSDGGYNTRTDLIDAPSCSLARGSSVNGLGKTCVNSTPESWCCVFC